MTADELQAGDLILPARTFGVVREVIPLAAHIRIVFTTGRARSFPRGEDVRVQRDDEIVGCPRLASCPRAACGPRTCTCDPCGCPICERRVERATAAFAARQRAIDLGEPVR